MTLLQHTIEYIILYVKATLLRHLGFQPRVRNRTACGIKVSRRAIPRSKFKESVYNYPHANVHNSNII